MGLDAVRDFLQTPSSIFTRLVTDKYTLLYTEDVLHIQSKTHDPHVLSSMIKLFRVGSGTATRNE